MKLPEDFFHWQVIFSVRPPQQTVTMFVGKLVRSVVKTEKIGSAIARSLLAVAFIATLASASASAAAQPREQQFNIPKQAVDQALDALATQANVFLLFPYDQVLAVDANPVKGKYSIQQALDILLKNTGLSGDLTQGGVITISPNDLNQNGKGKRMNINKRKNLLATFIAVFAAGATTQGADGAGWRSGDCAEWD